MRSELFDRINRISIIGGSGTGKTTLSENLGNILNLPVYHIDAFHHLENWVERDKAERNKLIMEKVSEDKWIIDGTYKDTLKERLDISDLVIYLDYSSIAAVKGALQRYFKYKGKERKDIPGCNEKISFHFISWVWNWRKNKRDTVLECLKEVDENKVLIFKNRRKLNKWFKDTLGKSIDTKNIISEE